MISPVPIVLNDEHVLSIEGASQKLRLFFMIFTGPSKPKVKIPEKSRTIEAQDQSPITLIIADNVTALVNTSITIQCPNRGVPTPTVTWTKDGEQIANDRRYTIQDDGSLLISEVVEDDSARYTCTADNIAGKDSASSTVQIVGKGILMILYYLIRYNRSLCEVNNL